MSRLVPKHRKYGDHPLRQEMDKLGMTAREFATWLGVNPSTIFNVMSGRHEPMPIIIQTVADALGVSYQEAQEICK